MTKPGSKPRSDTKVCFFQTHAVRLPASGGMGTRKSFPREVSSTASEGVIQREPCEGRGTSAILQNCIRNWRKPIGTPEPGEVSGTQIMKNFSCHEKEFGFYLQGRKEPRRTLCEGGSRSDLHVSKVTFAAAWIGLRQERWRQRNPWVPLQS